MIGLVVVSWLFERMQPGNTKAEQAERMEDIHVSVRDQLLAQADRVHAGFLAEFDKNDEDFDSERAYNLQSEEELLRDRAAAMQHGVLEARIAKHMARAA